MVMRSALLMLVLLALPAAACPGDQIEIRAEEMTFKLPIETDNIADYLRSIFEVIGDLLQGRIIAEDVYMKKATIKRILTIEAEEIRTPRVEMNVGLLSILGETIRSIDQLLRLISGREVKWENVYICASRMESSGMSFNGIRVFMR